MNREDDVIDLGTLFWNFLRSLRFFWWLIPLFCVISMVGGIATSVLNYRPMYRSSASFTVLTGDVESSQDSSSYGFYYDSNTAGQLAKTFPYVLGTNLLNDAIKDYLGVEVVNASLSASAVENSNLITMTSISNDPQDAQKVLEAAIEVYPDAARFVLGSTRFNMIELPTLPDKPFNSLVFTRRAIKFGGFGGFAAIALIALIAFLRKTIQKPEELKSSMNLENLGNIPEIKQKARSTQADGMISVLDKKVFAGYKEGMSSIYVRIEREMTERNGKVLLVSSTDAHEGKTTFALNLAFTASKMGKKVFYVDADFRKQEVYKRLMGEESCSLVEVFTKKRPISDCISVHEESGIWVFGGNGPVKNPQKILNHSIFRSMLNAMKQEMDLIILDVPPTGVFEDSTVLAKYADAAVCILRHDYIEKRKFIRTVSELEETGCPLLGYVFNFIPVHRSRSGYYGYGYGRYGYGYYGYGYGYGYGESKKKGSHKHQSSEEVSKSHSSEHKHTSEHKHSSGRSHHSHHSSHRE